ncbi:MAG: pseudouridine synthase [Rikenellaceae bacterium]|nr:pseudouridine synthase [Rikenellaceae bacterium]
MKNTKQDSTFAVSRFGRDKRERSGSAFSERVERSPRPRREADNEGQKFGAGRRDSSARRASYNPNFSADNRLREDYRRNDSGSFAEERGQREERAHRGAGRIQVGAGRGNRTSAAGRSKGSSFGSSYGSEQRSEGRGFKAQGRDGYQPKGGFKGGRKPFRSGDNRPKDYPKYNPAKQTGEMRLNRFLAQSGLCSRREADDFITAGLVTVNGVIVTELGTKIMPSDEVKFNDEKVQGEKKVYLVLNKPKGYVTSLEDPHADKTVMELVKGACTERIYPVGRLDKNSLGLLLFTNDGDITRQLTHPSQEKKKVYQVSLDKPLTRADMEQITEGITLEDGEIYADEVAYVSDNKKEVGIEIHSGRNRIVRRIFEHLGYSVQKLDRVYYAGITKKNLKRGQWRFLTREEVDRLKSGRYE